VRLTNLEFRAGGSKDIPRPFTNGLTKVTGIFAGICRTYGVAFSYTERIGYEVVHGAGTF